MMNGNNRSVNWIETDRGSAQGTVELHSIVTKDSRYMGVVREDLHAKTRARDSRCVGGRE